MKQKYIFSILFLAYGTAGFAQTKFDLGPYLKGLTAIKDSYLEAGLDVPLGEHSLITPYFRLPLTNKDKSLLVLDRNTSSWSFITAFQHEWDRTKADVPLNLWGISGQVEWGYNVFKYYPTGEKSKESKNSKNSVSGEVKVSYYHGRTGGKQDNWQLRLRYSNQFEEGKAVGVVNEANASGVITTTDMIITSPSKNPVFSPAIAYQMYHGKSNFSFTYALFYDTKGEKNKNNPFNGSDRARYEFWIFYYPTVAGTTNFKIGVGPFLSYRTKGSDDLNKAEYGAQVTVKVGSLFQSFF